MTFRNLAAIIENDLDDSEKDMTVYAQIDSDTSFEVNAIVFVPGETKDQNKLVLLEDPDMVVFLESTEESTEEWAKRMGQIMSKP